MLKGDRLYPYGLLPIAMLYTGFLIAMPFFCIYSYEQAQQLHVAGPIFLGTFSPLLLWPLLVYACWDWWRTIVLNWDAPFKRHSKT